MYRVGEIGKTRLAFQAGALVLAAIYAMIALVGIGLAQTTNSTTTTTTSTIDWSIDVAPLINIVISLLPAVLAIGIIKMLFDSLGRFGRFVRFKEKLPKVSINPSHVKLAASITAIAVIVAGFLSVTPTALAQTDASTGFDVSSMVNLVMSLMPLIIILVIMKALMNAFSGIAK